MTATDEILEAMRHGAEPLFLVGLLAWFEKEPEVIRLLIDRAGDVFYAEQARDRAIDQAARDLAEIVPASHGPAKWRKNV